MEAVGQKAEELFDRYAEKASVDIPANQETVKKYEAACREVENQKAFRDKLGAKRGGFIALIIISFVLAAICLFLAIARVLGDLFFIWIILALLFITGSIALIVYLAKVMKNRIKKADEALKILQDKANALLREAYGQMALLNALLDWGMPQRAIHEAVPLLELDDNFDVRKFAYLVEKYGLEEPEEENVSTYHIQTGSIQGNPFVWERDFVMKMFDKTYTGSIVIHWTTTYRDKNGSHTQHHSQTLTATVTRPAPSYSFSTYLVYANEAGPKLCFSRQPTVNIGADERKIEKQVKKGAKAAAKLERESMFDDDPHDLTLMSNTEFDVLFNGLNRNNEQEFRLLFTPLAQMNELALIKSKAPYGDDWSFYKNKKINTIMSRHSQTIDFHANPVDFQGYDYYGMKKTFRNYTQRFFQAIYFDLAPLLSIPLYQMTKPAEYIYEDYEKYESVTSFYEHEAVVNSMNKNLLKPDNCDTEIILKTEFIRKNGDWDEVEVVAHGFQAIPKTAVISKYGGDGRWHDVPVHYYEYEPVEKTSVMSIANAKTTRHNFSAFASNQAFQDLISRLGLDGGVYERKLFAFLNRCASNSADLSSLSASLKNLGEN